MRRCNILVAASLAVAGCAGSTPPVATGNTRSGPVADTSTHPVSRVSGKLGAIEVVDRHSVRLLKIDGVVQDAVRLRPPGVHGVIPNTVRLLRAVRPTARRVLVIGLGTGATSMHLLATGYRVTSVAQDGALAAVAREAFGFRGRVVIADSVEAIAVPDGGYDAVVWNTLARPEAKLVSSEAVRAVRNRLLARGGVLMIRIKASPRNPELARVAEQLGQSFTLIMGNGLGDERQNLTLMHSAEPINIAGDLGGLWPVVLPGDRTQAAADEQRTGRRGVLLVGYLARERHSGALCLDLPRWEKGAVRYLLTGPRSRRLGRWLPRKGAFPSYQELLDARKRVTTAHALLGGGGAPHSDLRLSPVVVALRGDARAVSVVRRDAASDAPTAVRRRTVTDPRLPYGGALYELEVSTVVGVYGPQEWKRPLVQLAAVARRATVAIERGDLGAAAVATGEGLALLDRRFGKVVAPRMQVRDELARLRAALLMRCGLPRAATCTDRAGPRPAGSLRVFSPTRRGKAPALPPRNSPRSTARLSAPITPCTSRATDGAVAAAG